MSSDSRDQRRIHELERQVAALTNDLEKIKVEQNNYLQNVSHQLVAPLNAIKWHIENITESRVSIERAKKVLRSIYSQSTIAVHLAKNFALMSNLEEDHALTSLKEPLQPVSLCQLLINIADDFQPLGWDKNIQIQVENRNFESAPDVLVMKPLISQVFSNIVENAVKYATPDSRIAITGVHDKSNDTVVVRIANHGIPLPAEIEKVFLRGYRSDEARNKYPAGTGFGLYIAKHIVEIHKGQITATPERHGASFLVALSVRGLEGLARQHAAKDRSTRR